jgi:hypothetical protein
MPLVTSARTHRIGRLVDGLAFAGVTATDSDQIRVQKVTLTLAPITVTVLAVIWVATCLALGLPVTAAIPFASYLLVARRSPGPA